jgi:hypothetical protein
MTTRRILLVRLVGSSLVLIVSVFFCHQLSMYQMTALVSGYGFSVTQLPGMCRWFAHSSPLLLVFPLLNLWVGVTALIKARRPDMVVEVMVWAVLSMSLLLAFGCILAWQQPYLLRG